jgi:hypothetical protein
MPKRVSIPVKNIEKAWKRAKIRCENCNKSLNQKMIEKKEIIRRDKVVVEIWDNHQCWNCEKQSRIIILSYEDRMGLGYLQDEPLGSVVEEKFPFFYKGYSQTLGDSYYANHCPFCKRIQGEHFIIEWMLDNRNMGFEPIDTIILEIPIASNLREEIPIISYEKFPKRHYAIHHIDKNPRNNAINNLQLLCSECHHNSHKKRAFSK